MGGQTASQTGGDGLETWEVHRGSDSQVHCQTSGDGLEVRRGGGVPES